MEQQTIYSISLSCQINLKNTAGHVLTRLDGIYLFIDICKRKHQLQEKLNYLT